MQTYRVELQADSSESFRCIKAANSCDLDVKKKLKHELEITVNITDDFNIGVIIGNSGSGKTTLAHEIFGKDCFDASLDLEKTIIDQLPEKYTYDECVSLLTSIGLSSVSCWVRPLKTLSNGQRARAQAAYLIAKSEANQITAIDEWTSVVDRTVAKAMSHCLQKATRKNNKKIIILSCHYDILEWLQPDFIIDCNTQTYTDNRKKKLKDKKISYSTLEKLNALRGEILASITI